MIVTPAPLPWTAAHRAGADRVRFGHRVATCSCGWRCLKERHGRQAERLLAFDHDLHLGRVAREMRQARAAAQS